MIKILSTLIFILISFNADANTDNVLELSCEYDPSLIKKEQMNIGFLEHDKLDRSEICRTFGCDDTIEIKKYENLSDGEAQYRLRNSWFNHQGILLDKFNITDDNIIINSFISQSYVLESYLINKNTGDTKRTFYRFDHPKFFDSLRKLENNSTKEIPLYNKRGKLSLETLKFYSLKPLEIFYFEGRCQKGIGV